MKPMTGEIGTWLLGDKQVGGFKAWTVIVFTQPSPYTIIKASGYWVLETPLPSTLTSRFYALDGQFLDMFLEKESIVEIRKDSPLDTFILKPVEIKFPNNFDWRNL